MAKKATLSSVVLPQIELLYPQLSQSHPGGPFCPQSEYKFLLMVRHSDPFVDHFTYFILAQDFSYQVWWSSDLPLIFVSAMDAPSISGVGKLGPGGLVPCTV